MDEDENVDVDEDVEFVVGVKNCLILFWVPAQGMFGGFLGAMNSMGLKS